MLRKLLTSAAVLGLLTAGTASATGLGTNASPTLAAEVITVEGCEAPGAEVTFATQFEGNFGANGGSAAARLQSVTITGFDAACEGKAVEAMLFDNEGGTGDKGSFLGRYLTGTVQSGTVVMSGNPNWKLLDGRIDPAVVDGISVVVKGA